MKNKIIHTEAIEGIKGLEDQSIDLVVTSPPYYNTQKKYQRGKGIHYSQEIPEPLYVIEDTFEYIYPKVKDNGFYCMNLGFSYGETGVMRPFHVVQRAIKYNWFCIDVIIWHKRNPIPIKNRLTNSFEYIFVLAKHPHTEYPSKDTIGYKHNFIETSVVKSEVEGLSAVYPVEIPLFCVEVFSKEGDLVLDPFMGSGTTAIACNRLKRCWLGFEIGKEFIPPATDRIKHHNRVGRL